MPHQVRSLSLKHYLLLDVFFNILFSNLFFFFLVGHAVTIIIVVCVGFLVFMIVLGVIRIRSAHHRNNDPTSDDQEMAWDDNSLNITVNPLDVCFFYHLI